MYINISTREEVEEIPVDGEGVQETGFLPLVTVSLNVSDSRYYEDREVSYYDLDTDTEVTRYVKVDHTFLPELTDFINSGTEEIPVLVDTSEFTKVDWANSGHYLYVEENPVDITDCTVFANRIESTYVGDYIGWTHYRAKHALTIKKQRAETINDKRDTGLLGGFTALGYVFDSDAESMQSIMAKYIRASGDSNYTTMYITKDNQTISLSNSDILAVGIAAMDFKEGIIFAARVEKDSL